MVTQHVQGCTHPTSPSMDEIMHASKITHVHGCAPCPRSHNSPEQLNNCTKIQITVAVYKTECQQRHFMAHRCLSSLWLLQTLAPVPQPSVMPCLHSSLLLLMTQNWNKGTELYRWIFYRIFQRGYHKHLCNITTSQKHLSPMAQMLTGRQADRTSNTESMLMACEGAVLGLAQWTNTIVRYVWLTTPPFLYV